MALDLSSYSEFIQENPDILIKTVLKETFLQKATPSVYENVGAGIHRTRLFSPVAHLSSCCAKPEGTSGFSEFDMEAVCILDGSSYCETELLKVQANAGATMVFGAGNETAGSVGELIIKGQLAAFAQALEILTFQGDKLSANSNLNKVDGLIKILTNSPDSIKLNITDGNILDAINEIVDAVPLAAQDLDDTVAIIVGKEVFKAYQRALISSNLYHYNPGTQGKEGEMDVLGINGFKIMTARGLNGTGKIIATPLKNIFWLVNNKPDQNTIDWDYDKVNQQYYWRIKTIFGVDVALKDWAVIASVDPSVLTNKGAQNIAIVSPLNVDGTALNVNDITIVTP